MRKSKAELAAYILLRGAVLVILVLELLSWQWFNVFLCFLTLLLFLIPSIVYALLLTLFLACAVAGGIITGFSLPILLLIIGAALFLLSDLVLSMIYFDGNDSRVLIVVNHVLYYAAQFLIALSVYYIGMKL